MGDKSLLYQIGNFVGRSIKELRGTKAPVKEVTLDLSNGTESADGIQEPTSSFTKALLSATQFSPSRIKIVNSPGSITFKTAIKVENQVLVIDGTSNSERLKIVFSPITDKNKAIVGKLLFENSYLKFQNLEFAISNDVEPEKEKDPLSTPFFAEYSTLIFKDCKFTYTGSFGDKIAFLAGRGSSVFLYNCEFENQDTSKKVRFMYSPSFGIPNLLAYDDLTEVTEYFELRDRDSLFLAFLKPE